MSNVLNKQTFEYRKSVNTVQYMDGSWLINPDLTDVEYVPVKYWKIDGETIVEMSQEEKNIINNSEVEILRNTLIDQIDDKTAELIAEGFYVFSDKFSLSISAQTNAQAVLIELKTSGLPDDYILDEPIEISMLNGGVVHFNTPAEFYNYWNIGKETIKSHYHAGAMLREQVLIMSYDDLISFVDER